MDQIVGKTGAADHRVVSREAWLASRAEFLGREKEFSRLRDELAAARRALPWVRVETDYVFDGPAGQCTLGDLFDGRSQLFVYHFMFGPDWEEGCRSCSFVADGFDGAAIHLAARDVTLAAVSRAPIEKLSAFRQRMGWHFPWFSSGGSGFNHDYGVAFTKEELAAGEPIYNYGSTKPPIEDLHGASVFYRDRDGTIYHTYSTYGRGLDPLLNTYNVLDMMPKGRDEDDLGFTMEWVRHRDRYEHVLRAGGGCCGG